MQAWPSPMSTTPAFSPGPQITRGPVVGNLPRWILLDLYEQCSLHITENTPNSTALGSRFRRWRMTSYSYDFRPYSAAVSRRVLAGCALMAGLLPGLARVCDRPISRQARCGVASRPGGLFLPS